MITNKLVKVLFQISHISHSPATHVNKSQQSSPRYDVTENQNGNGRRHGNDVSGSQNGNGNNKHNGNDVTGSQTGNGKRHVNDVTGSQTGNNKRSGNDVTGSSSSTSGLSPQSLAMLSSTSGDVTRTSRKNVIKTDVPIEMSETICRQETKAVVHM